MDFNDAQTKHPTSAKRISEMEKRYKLAKIVIDLEEHAGVQELLKALRNEIVVIDGRLTTDRKMTQQDRDIVFAHRDCWEYLLDFFSRAQMTKGNVEHVMAKYE